MATTRARGADGRAGATDRRCRAVVGSFGSRPTTPAGRGAHLGRPARAATAPDAATG